MTIRTRAILGLVGVFLLGGVIGALSVCWFVRDRVREAHSLREQEGFIRHFERKLELTEAQRDSLREELGALYVRLDEVRQETVREYNAVLDTFRRQVLPRLTPEQQRVYLLQEERLRSGMPPGRARRQGGPPGTRGPRRDVLMPPSVMPPSPTVSSDSGRTRPSPPATAARRTARGERWDSVASRPDRAFDTMSIDTSQAEGPMPDGEITKLERHIEKLRRRIDLAPDQVERLRSIGRTAHDRVLAAAREMPRSPARRAAIHRIIMDARREMAAVLTPEQQNELLKLMREHRGRRRGGGDGSAGG